ncbi:DNA polymerase I [Aureibacter tunicatorum]|uniref:DNA polymerase I n=1 Tax=Aureibacter tunicatorum TaxID=866807 RepID=A0AAE4BRH1_9BACT|nr:DNA polymerase I [Aureibacter tunicatorum]MDR6237790.1 DNA polymerase-1 [Aureibacter tunicatorum]BDD02825.1 DNA polymerase I [Aureibacter tunicatorum]
MPDKKLFLLDAMALIYRAHFAFSKNPRINSKGLNTGAQLGFTNTLFEVLRKEKPTHIAVAFDVSGPTFRHERFPEYKAQRQEMPEDIRTAIPMVKDIVRAFNIPVLEKQGFEADDIIGTMAKRASKHDFEVYMMTPDKDYAQLVEEHIYLYKPAYMGNGVDVLGVEEVLKKFDLENVDQVRDYLGLMGDASDNIPGIPGVGPKTAVKYLKAYGTLEGLLENVNDLKGKAKEKVTEFGQQGILSKELATIHIDVPVDFDEEDFKYTGPNEEELGKIFDELEFRTLKTRILGQTSAPAPAKKSTPQPTADAQGQLDMFGNPTAQTTSKKVSKPTEEIIPSAPLEKKNIDTYLHDYKLVDTPELRQSLAYYLSLQDEICFDTETTSLDANTAELVGLAFAYKKGEAYYVPVPADQEEAQKIVEDFRAVLENEKITKIAQNIKYDLLIMKNYGVEVKGKFFDTMIAHYLLEPDNKHNMDVLAENYLNYTPISITELIGKKGKKQGNMRDVEVSKVVEYAGEDADITLQLKEVFAPMIKANQVDDLFENIESPLIDVLATTEANGVKIDTDFLKTLSVKFGEQSTEIEKKIYELAGQEFNIASPKQLGEILFGKMKLVDKPKKTASGQFATGEEILSKLAHEHEICQLILDFRGLQKLKSTYVDALPELISEKDGLIHTSYNQAVAATGRLSSTNPNLQNIPIRTPEGREIRKAFIPRDENHVILAADYSQVELRIMAAFAKDESMIEAFKEGKDIHSMTASKIFKVPLEEVTSDMRRKAKTANFGIIYGISAFGLSQRLDILRKEAAQIIDAYFEEFPAVKAYMDKVINDAKDNEYVETITGRKRYLRDINSRNATVRGFAERNAINAPIQGSAADVIKKAMIEIHHWMQSEKLQSKMILQVHDELVFDVVKDELELFKTKIPEFMRNAADMEVPLEVEVGIGADWLEAH